jgi:hypothetical protein
MPPNNFDRAKPFYPLVTNYIVQLFSYKELAGWDLIGRKPLLAVIDDYVNSLQGSTSEKKELKKGMTDLFGPLQLRSEFQGNYIEVEFEEMAKDFASNFNYLLPYFIRAAGILLVSAHEFCKYHSYHDKGPLWEFLRHCRNAVSHNGKFNFKDGEPKRLAEWGQFHLDRSLQGRPLFKERRNIGMLSPGDPIRLLWDIEQAYPNMKA